MRTDDQPDEEEPEAGRLTPQGAQLRQLQLGRQSSPYALPP